MRHGFLLRSTLGLALSLGAMSQTSLAFAADPSPQDIAQARDLGQQAQAQFDAGKFAESEKLWAGATNLYPAAPTLTLGLARTQAKLGKYVLAQENYNKIIREHGQSANLSPAFKAALEAANAEIGAVSAKIAGVVITVEGPSNPTVTIDGQPIPAAVLGLKRPVDPGSHVVKAEAPGYKPGETTFQVAESATAEAKLKLEKGPAPVVAATPEPQQAQPSSTSSAPPAEVSTKSSRKTLAIVALGVGGAGLILGGVTGALALGKHGDIADKCPDNKCPNTVSGDVDSYKTMGMLSTVGFIVGGVGIAAGAVLWFTAPKENATAAYRTVKQANGFAWQPYVGVGGGGVTGRF